MGRGGRRTQSTRAHTPPPAASWAVDAAGRDNGVRERAWIRAWRRKTMCRVGLLWPGNAAIFCPAPRWLRGGSPAPRRAPTIPHAPEGSKGHAGAREGPHSWLGARFASASVAIASSSRRRSSRKAFSGSSPSETGAGAAGGPELQGRVVAREAERLALRGEVLLPVGAVPRKVCDTAPVCGTGS